MPDKKRIATGVPAGYKKRKFSELRVVQKHPEFGVDMG